MNSDVRKVYESLFVSGYQGCAQSGDKFDRVVSMAAPSTNTDDEYIITDGEHSFEDFSDAVDTVIGYLDNEETVLVNCQAGLSRSVSVCIAAQVCHYNLSYVESLSNARFGHRLPEPELLDSCDRYISENADYVEQRVVDNKTEDRLESVCSDIIDLCESDENIDQDRLESHVHHALDLELR